MMDPEDLSVNSSVLHGHDFISIMFSTGTPNHCKMYTISVLKRTMNGIMLTFSHPHVVPNSNEFLPCNVN